MPAPPVIPFMKASACGNDFLIIEAPHVAEIDLAGFARRICERHNGVGADGVEYLFPSAHADVQARLFNADGSEAEISGNGTRCVAAYLISRRESDDEIHVQTLAGIKRCTLRKRDGCFFDFAMALGEPRP